MQSISPTSLDWDRITPHTDVSLIIISRGLISTVPRFPTTTTRPVRGLSNGKSLFKLTFANISRTKSIPSRFLVALYTEKETTSNRSFKCLSHKFSPQFRSNSLRPYD